MDFRDALTEALADVDGQIEQQQDRIAKAQARLQALQEEKRGLELAIGRHGRAVAIAASNGTSEEWRALNRSDATLAALRHAKGPLSPNEIVQVLHAQGRSDDTPALISAALSYLARQTPPRVQRMSRGQWMAADSKATAGVALAAIAALATLGKATKGG